jgi:hypothetical protein
VSHERLTNLRITSVGHASRHWKAVQKENRKHDLGGWIEDVGFDILGEGISHPRLPVASGLPDGGEQWTPLCKTDWKKSFPEM